jgi:hypothetical protein
LENLVFFFWVILVEPSLIMFHFYVFLPTLLLEIVSKCAFKLSTSPWRRIEEWSYSSTHSLTSALDGGE